MIGYAAELGGVRVRVVLADGRLADQRALVVVALAAHLLGQTNDAVGIWRVTVAGYGISPPASTTATTRRAARARRQAVRMMVDVVFYLRIQHGIYNKFRFYEGA